MLESASTYPSEAAKSRSSSAEKFDSLRFRQFHVPRCQRDVIGGLARPFSTTAHIERAFLTVRQELKRFQRKGLGYSKDLETHRLAVAMHFGIYNFVRVHKTLGTTPAVAAGVELERWSLEHIVEMTADYLRRKEDAKFEKAFESFVWAAEDQESTPS